MLSFDHLKLLSNEGSDNQQGEAAGMLSRMECADEVKAAATTTQPVIGIQAVDKSMRSSSSKCVDQQGQDPSTADPALPAKASQIISLTRATSPQ